MLQELLKDSSILFAIYMFGYATYIFLGGTVAIWNLYRNRVREKIENKLDHDFYFPVSSLVPAFNEMPIRLQVPCKEIKEIYSGAIGNRSIVMISKQNGGCKADAINAGINISQYPYFVSMDADEILQADALKYSAKFFLSNDDVIAVGGLIRIANGVKFEHAMPVDMRISRNHVVSMQTLEYYRSFMASRVFQDTFNGNLNISGGYGFF